jgi:type I restriction enzyme S subunit
LSFPPILGYPLSLRKNHDVEANEDNVAYPGDILFAWSGSLDVYRWHRNEALINQHIFKVIPKGKIPQWFVHCHLIEAMSFFQGIAEGKATTMGHIKREHLGQAKLAMPKAELIDAADSLIAPLYLKVHSNHRESFNLEKIRDTLLPKLLSGEIRVGQAEKIVEEAV